MAVDDNKNPEDMFSHLEHGADESVVKQVDPDPPESIPATPGRIVQAQTKNGLGVFVGSANSNSPSKLILDSIASHHSLYWLINAKAAGIPNEPPFEIETDLLSEFGPAVGQENSLHLFLYGDASIDPVLNQAIGNNAAVLVAASQPVDLVAAELTPVLAWFIDSKNLKFQLDNGADFLVEQLFAPVQFIFLFDLESDNWVLFNGGQTPLSWDEIGFPFEPSPLR